MKIEKRYGILILAALVAGAFFAVWHGVPKSVKTDEPLNILLVTIDTLRADHLGCYGNRQIKTPAIDRLAQEGVLFKNVVCQAPLTGPSHASILTGLYPQTHGVRINGYPLRDRVLTLAKILKISQYKTAGFVSVDFLGDDVSGLGRGFDAFDWPKQVEQPAEAATQKAIAWLDKNGKDKFFVWIHYYDAHSDYSPPYPYNVMYDPSYAGQATGSTQFLDQLNKGEIKLSPRDHEHIDALYSGEISYVDRSIGVLLDHLKDTGVYKNTLIIITADHGEALGEHENYFGHSLQLYDPSIMVPLIMVNKSALPSNKRVEAQVESIDILPTALELAGLRAPEEVEGKTLIPLIESRKRPAAYREKAFSETQNMRWGGLILKDNLADAEKIHEKVKSGKEILRCLRTPRWKFILSQENSNRVDELYGMKDDPEEKINLIYENRDTAEELSKDLKSWMRGEEKSALDESKPMDEKTLETLKSLGYIN